MGNIVIPSDDGAVVQFKAKEHTAILRSILRENLQAGTKVIPYQVHNQSPCDLIPIVRWIFHLSVKKIGLSPYG